MAHPNPPGSGYPRSPRDPMNEPHGGYSHANAGRRDGYGQPFAQGPVDQHGRYNPHGPNSYLPDPYAVQAMQAGPPAPRRRGNGYATASLILGIVTVLSSWFFMVLGSIAAIAGIICGGVGLSHHRRGIVRGGQTRSIFGIILNSLALIIAIIFAVLVFMLIYQETAGTIPDPAAPGGHDGILERSRDRYFEHT